MIYKTLFIGAFALLLLLRPISAQTGELIIHDGSSMIINSGSTLTMNCDTITLESGATLTNDGTILSLGELIEELGSIYSNTGTVELCTSSSGKMFYVIPAANGKTVIIYL